VCSYMWSTACSDPQHIVLVIYPSPCIFLFSKPRLLTANTTLNFPRTPVKTRTCRTRPNVSLASFVGGIDEE
jgi:hypothetical protein